MNRALILLVALFLLSQLAWSQVETGKYLYKQHQHEGYVLNYRILYPHNFDENKRYPLVLFLHGRGESGSDNEKQLVHGSKLFLDSLHKYPAVVIFPQCPE
ncbi:MAG: hypothetical protein KDD10_06685, partial [Phaeodactylibacter sp.]|nr:hypothetical protein [Phaeodactylibacter sp.]